MAHKNAQKKNITTPLETWNGEDLDTFAKDFARYLHLSCFEDPSEQEKVDLWLTSSSMGEL